MVGVEFKLLTFGVEKVLYTYTTCVEEAAHRKEENRETKWAGSSRKDTCFFSLYGRISIIYI